MYANGSNTSSSSASRGRPGGIQLLLLHVGSQHCKDCAYPDMPLLQLVSQ
jgi:hypothetical protein